MFDWVICLSGTVELTLTFGTLIFVEIFVLLFVTVGFLFVTGHVVLHFGCGWKISKGIFPRRWWFVLLIDVQLDVVGILFRTGTTTGWRSTLFTRRLSTAGFCIRGAATGLTVGVLCTAVGEFIVLPFGEIFDSRWRLFESKRRVNSSFFSCIAGVSSAVINGGDTLGNTSFDGIINDFFKLADGSVGSGGKSAVEIINDLDKLADGSVGKSVVETINDFVKLDDELVGIGGKGVYDERTASVRLSHNVSKLSSRWSCVESTGIPLWRWKRIDERRLQALLTDGRQ